MNYAPSWEAKTTNVNAGALELQQIKLSDTLGWLEINECALLLILRYDTMFPPHLNERLQSGLGCSPFIFKIEGQNIIRHLGHQG